MKIKKEINEKLDNSRTDNYEKAEKAGGRVELTKKYLEAGERYMENGAVIKRRGVKKYKKGIASLNKKKGKKVSYTGDFLKKKEKEEKKDNKPHKFFFGGLLGAAAGISLIEKLRKKREEKQKGSQGEGRIMKVKVISDGQAEQVGKDDTAQAEKEELEKAEKMEEGTTGAGSGEAVMKKGGVTKYKGGGTFYGIDSGKARPKPKKLDKDNVSIKSEEQKIAEKNVKKKGGTKVISKGSQAAVKKGAPKMLGRVGSKFVPGVGWVALGADAGYLAMKTKAKGYAEMDKRSPGTSKHLETGAYGNQTSASGHKVKGTFFGSMKKKGGVVIKRKTKKK